MWGFPGGSDGKESAWNAGDPGLIPGSGRSSGEGNANPLQYSCLENSMDRGARWATVHGITKTREILFGKQERNVETSEEFLPTATDFFETMEVSLYPNPTNDKFFVEIKSDTSEKAEATLTHISGAVLEKRILVNSLESFDLSGHAVGVYLLRIEVGNETHIWKVIKK